MSSSEHLLVLFSIVIGLGLSDLLVSARAIAFRDGTTPVRFHPVPVLWAIFAVLLLLQAWWGLFALFSQDTYVTTLSVYLGTFAALTPMYLFASAALPSPASQAADLAAYYSENARRMFFLIALGSLTVLLYSLLQWDQSLNSRAQVHRMLGIIVGILGSAIKSSRLHVILMLVMIAQLITFFTTRL